MQVVDTKVMDVIRRTENVISVRLAMPEDNAFEAGQFLGVTLFSNGAEISRYLSFSSSPTEKGYIEVTKRLTASDFSAAMNALRAGDPVRIKYPMGKFILEGEQVKYAFLAGGIGITPIRSMWKFTADMNVPTDMVLLYSNRSEPDIIFRDDLESMARQNKGLKLVLSLDSLANGPEDWKGCCGYIDAAMVRREIPDYAERVFYLCGPIPMVKKMVEMLKTDLSVPAERIRQESISGY